MLKKLAFASMLLNKNEFSIKLKQRYFTRFEINDYIILFIFIENKKKMIEKRIDAISSLQMK